MSALPTAAYLLATTLTTVARAAVVATLVALLVLALRVRQRASLKSALIGGTVAIACAAGALLTGESRGFFLAPLAAPLPIIGACLATVAVKRPLAGYLLNPLVGGPSTWRDAPALLRIYASCTLACAALNALTFGVQLALYRSSDAVWLAALHVANAPLFATVVGWTIVRARRACSVPETAVAG